MNNFFVRSLASISLVATLAVSTTVCAQQTVSLSKGSLTGLWKSAEREYTFDKSGTSLVFVNNRTCPGIWLLEAAKVTITPKKLMYKKDDPCSKTRVLEVKSMNANGMEAIETTDKNENKELHLIKK